MRTDDEKVIAASSSFNLFHNLTHIAASRLTHRN